MELFVRAHKNGVVVIAPFEVHLPGIAKPVQPDVLFVPAEDWPSAPVKFFEGVPALIVEVLSPSTGRTDRLVKLDAYERAGVREYWLVSPKVRSIELHVLTGGRLLLREQYGPGERVVSEVLPGLEMAVDGLFAP
jgi:Uma2 family endonuclease